MGVVRFALRFPYTFYVVAALILFLGVSAIAVTPTDIFPQIDIPVVSVIWQYTETTGMSICGKRSEEHTSELQSHSDLVCRLLLEKKKTEVFHGHKRLIDCN